MEIWKDVVGYEGLYQVSNYGKVKSLRKNKMLKTQVTIKGYLRVGLSKDAKQVLFYVHRLVAIAFIPNPLQLLEINHKDEDKGNNVLSNLEWCTTKYNCNYGNHPKRVSISLSKTVYQYDKNYKLINKWNSTRNADKYGFNHSHIASCCRNERKTHKGYIWSYNLLKDSGVLPVIERKEVC